MQYSWKAGRFDLSFSLGRPLLMGIVNVTPDSFSDGGCFCQVDAALMHARQLLDDGADVLDFGGESTRPGAPSVSVEQEWQRLEPVLREVVSWGVPVSVDTKKTEVMRRALGLGVDVLNDVNGFQDEGAVQVLKESHAGAVVMHMQGQPANMQNNPEYVDVVQEVQGFLRARLKVLTEAGVSQGRILVDLGFGFGKTLEHNVTLMQALLQFAGLGAGVLVGVSRKRMIGELLGQQNPAERVHGSVGAAVFAATQGAAVLRVHDVRATREALTVFHALASPSV